MKYLPHIKEVYRTRNTKIDFFAFLTLTLIGYFRCQLAFNPNQLIF